MSDFYVCRLAESESPNDPKVLPVRTAPTAAAMPFRRIAAHSTREAADSAMRDLASLVPGVALAVIAWCEAEPSGYFRALNAAFTEPPPKPRPAGDIANSATQAIDSWDVVLAKHFATVTNKDPA